MSMFNVVYSLYKGVIMSQAKEESKKFPFCRECGCFHLPEDDCSYVWMICNQCGNKSKTAPDVPLFCDMSKVFCGQCPNEGDWRFEHPA